MSGRVALVTGGSRGIGQGIAASLIQQGYRVAIGARDLARTERTAADFDADVLAVELDVTSSISVSSAILRVQEQLGSVEILVNNAGGDDDPMPFLETNEDAWERSMDLNFTGTLRVIRAVVPGMIEREFGRVVNISSDAGRVGSSLEAVYSGAKGGIIAFSKTLAREVARRGVTVNVVSPGPTDTPLLQAMLSAQGERAAKMVESLVRAVPMRRLATPEDVAGAVAYFVSDDARYVTGQTLSVSGGLTMI